MAEMGKATIHIELTEETIEQIERLRKSIDALMDILNVDRVAEKSADNVLRALQVAADYGRIEEIERHEGRMA